jgi:hypothetical protein
MAKSYRVCHIRDTLHFSGTKAIIFAIHNTKTLQTVCDFQSIRLPFTL